jgi:hypothetical protein
VDVAEVRVRVGHKPRHKPKLEQPQRNHLRRERSKPRRSRKVRVEEAPRRHRLRHKPPEAGAAAAVAEAFKGHRSHRGRIW